MRSEARAGLWFFGTILCLLAMILNGVALYHGDHIFGRVGGTLFTLFLFANSLFGLFNLVRELGND